MLDLSIAIQKLTQGQAPAEMTVAQAPAAAPMSAAQPALPGPAGPAGGGAPAPVDAEALAHRVYALMQQDLIVDNVRRGR